MTLSPLQRLHQLSAHPMPVLLAPMAGSGGVALAMAVAQAGGIASLPCAMLSVEQLYEHVAQFRMHTQNVPLNVNFFAHTTPPITPEMLAAWHTTLQPYYTEYQINPTPNLNTTPSRAPFNEQYCEAIETLRPEIVSFHFGLPDPELLTRIKATGALVLSSATTVEEACWLEAHGCDVIIAQGLEAGGHRAMFLHDDLSTQTGLFSLLPRIVAATSLPVIAAGGIATREHIVAAKALGAAGVQIGTAYLSCPESEISGHHRRALTSPSAAHTALTTVFSGRPARGIVNRAMRELEHHPSIPPFPFASIALTPLRQAAEAAHRVDFSPLWAGQSASLNTPQDAASLTRTFLSALNISQ